MRWPLILMLLVLVATGVLVCMQDDGGTTTASALHTALDAPSPGAAILRDETAHRSPTGDPPRSSPTLPDADAPNQAKAAPAKDQRLRIDAPPEDTFLKDWLLRKKRLEGPVLERLQFGTASAGEMMQFNRDVKALLNELITARGTSRAEEVLEQHPLSQVDERTGVLRPMRARRDG